MHMEPWRCPDNILICNGLHISCTTRSRTYLDRKVSRFISALEPNTLHASGDSKIVQCQRIHGNRRVRESILSCGAEDISSVQVLAGLQELNSVDTLISILALCFVPELEQTLSALVRNVLKPGRTLLFCEHVLSSRDDVAWWRHFRSPVWGLAFDGCKLARSTHLCIESMRRVTRNLEDEQSLLLRKICKIGLDTLPVFET